MPASPTRFRCRGALLLIPVLFGFVSPATAKEPADSIAFFENRIRPVLVKHCYECHAADAEDIGGSLWLDSSDAMMHGGDSGPAITPGDAAASLLVSAIRYESSEMPPQGKLPDAVIKDIEDWIAAGATDPRDESTVAGFARDRIDLESGRQFWSFRPLAFTPPPVQPDANQTPLPNSPSTIDRFLAASIEEAGIVPNELAEPETRLRRLAFDLTGLPPSIELQQQWTDDPSWQHWQRIVDEMLDSPAFAEHWARHWMDVARYADSNGSDFNATFHEAWRYRDYLIRSFAVDRPFDEMIRQQIAGDQLPAETDSQRHDNIVATTFLMLGTKMLSERDKPKLELDVVDEQIDTVGRAFMGMTLGCARCHDHKFDPIAMQDYYALAGIFKSTVTLKGESQEYVSTWNRVALPTTEAHRKSIDDHDQKIAEFKSEIKTAEAMLAEAKAGLTDSIPGMIIDDSQATKIGYWRETTYTQGFIGKGYVHDDNSKKGTATIRFAVDLPVDGEYEIRIAYSTGTNRASNVPVVITTADGDQSMTFNQRKSESKSVWSTLGTFRFTADVPAAVTLSNADTDGYVIADAVQFLSADDLDKLQNPDLSEQGIAQRKGIDDAQKSLADLKQNLKQTESEKPPPSPVAMAPTDRDTNEIADSPLHIRGEAGNLGETVPRGFLQVCSNGDATIADPVASGRLELADWLTDPDHPLVARVYVNRVWMHLTGEGLVRTVDNFGERGERPSHPELLDYLASDFVRSGWLLKPLVRQIVHSTAYHRSSDFNAASVAIDPENRLRWRMSRRRLPAEAIRDTMVSATGTLDPSPTFEIMKGHGVLVSGNNGNSDAGKIQGINAPRRSIYLPIVRGFLAPMMTALDAADPDLLVGRRPTTNVPGQALILINSPEVHDWARATATRVIENANGFDERLRFAYQLCLQRPPTEQDRALANDFFADEQDSLDAWHQWIAAIFAGTEFRLLD